MSYIQRHTISLTVTLPVNVKVTIGSGHRVAIAASSGESREHALETLEELSSRIDVAVEEERKGSA